ncbi:type III secretion system inner membrane ring subunit SctD [Bordetella bronchialis]|uniref:EscD/YscD/HrpQ family type III secretion system inner membrane ring protein n=1 Tax=Bordetella bronchialis TaxID=463025 RepID=A0A193G1X1_9BORD|nr:type III secretion system inner membrane ring subunit SctD [Bordetella bronchialis]ANN73446.1 EscD/YscD/HrpQ family type III secretion system inner membrane ring protein [Bordetella bronchialis]
MTQDLELRVLTGIHQGARCPIHDGALIGSHERCDVVLCDDGIAEAAARLQLSPTGWGLAIQDDKAQSDTTETSPDLALMGREASFGTPCRLGTVLLAVARCGDPWPELAALEAMAAPAETPSADSDRQVRRDNGPGDPRAAHPSEGNTARARMSGEHGVLPMDDDGRLRGMLPRRPKATGWRWAVGSLLILLVFGSVASFPPGKVAALPSVQGQLDGNTEALTRVRELLADNGYAGRVQASWSPDHEIVVTGWVHDEAQHDRLATTLSTIWPLPALRVGTQTQAARSIGARTADLDASVFIDFMPTGALKIRGVAASEAIRQEAYRRWREDAGPQAEMTLILVADLTDSLNRALASAGAPPVAATWKDKTLRIDAGTLDGAQRQSLNAALDALPAAHRQAISLDEGAAAAVQGVPFRIQTVVSGKQPWVVLDDGTRIAPGGTHGAYRLTSIEDGSVVFDGPVKTVISR